ncbi:uncharacterized protein [Argopecten irradians]|uniref:uncharacterized protein n=1 Tax=Argopecten irradians TaxID=31199 RepID=UPI003720E199
MWKFLYVVMVCIHQVTSDSVVRVSGGILSGVKLQTPQGHVTTFLGVPYAKAPLGTLRFQKPDTAVKWSGVQHATDFGPICIQNIRKDELQNRTMSENCLFLNIYVPGNIGTSRNQFPVVVIIHPGNFQKGSGAMIDGKSISISNDAIVVTFNFRLGIFGFMSLVGPSNVGLLDQVAALRWVKENIARFHGNPKNVVLVCDYITCRKHISSTFNNLYDKIVTYKADYEFGSVTDTSPFLNSKDVRQHCASVGMALPKCLMHLDSTLLLNSSHVITGWRARPLFWPVPDSNFPASAYRAWSGGSMNVVDIILTDLSFLNHTSPRNECLSIDQSSQFIVESLAGDKDESTQQILMKTLTTFYFSAQDCGTSMAADFLWSSVLSFANSYYTHGLTLLTSTVLSNDKNPTLMCVLTNCSVDVQTVHYALSQFITHGYPTFADEAMLWRPYTPMSKNYLSISGGTISIGDVRAWPYRQLELLWFDLLTLLGEKLGSGKSDDAHKMPNACLNNYAEEQWGLSAPQLEALLFSLILSTLFLVVVVIALFRILCHFRGRKFYRAQGKGTNKKKAEPSSNHVEPPSHIVLPNHTGLQHTRSRNHTERDNGTHNCQVNNSTTPL